MTTLIRTTLLVLLVTATVDAATAQEAKKDTDDKLFPGAKLLHKFKYAVQLYQTPILLDAKAGPQLLIIQNAPVVEGSKSVEDPNTPLVFWDVAESKELHKITKEGMDELLRPIPVAGGLSNFCTFEALAPDGKTAAYTLLPGSLKYYQIGVYEFATRKSRVFPTKYTGPDPKRALSPAIQFAPDGALVVMHNGQCTIQEIDKPKPRLTFKLIRGSAPGPSGPGPFGLHQVTEGQLMISPGGSHLAVATAGGPIAVYDLKTGAVPFLGARH